MSKPTVRSGHVLIDTNVSRHQLERNVRHLQRAGASLEAIADGKIEAHEVRDRTFNKLSREAKAQKWGLKFVETTTANPALPEPAAVATDIKIAYRHYNDLDLTSVPRQSIELPFGFDELLNEASEVRLNDHQWLSESVAAFALERHGWGNDALQSLSPRQAVDLSLAYTMDKITYREVDEDMDFIEQHGRFLPMDEYLRLGEGDCDKYADSTVAVFAQLKQGNDRLNNVYLIPSRGLGGGLTQPHAWTALFVARENGLTVTHLDPTFADNSGELMGERGWHVAKYDAVLRAQILSEAANDELQQLAWEAMSSVFDKAPTTSMKRTFLAKMAKIAGLGLTDESKMAEVRQRYEALAPQLDESKAATLHATVLYFSFVAAERSQNADDAQAFVTELTTSYPNESWGRVMLSVSSGPSSED